MRVNIFAVAFLLQFASSCVKKPSEATSPPPPSPPAAAPMDANHRAGIVVADPVTGEVRTPYQPTEKEQMKLAAFEAELSRFEAAKKNLAPAKKLFQTYCAQCHGPEGRGGGPLADSLDVAPTNFHEWPIKFGSRPIDLALTISGGRNNNVMPAFGGSLKQDELWSLVALVSSWIEARPASKPLVP